MLSRHQSVNHTPKDVHHGKCGWAHKKAGMTTQAEDKHSKRSNLVVNKAVWGHDPELVGMEET